MPHASTGPLAGVRLVEFAAIGPVPLAGMILADLGCDVVRVGRSGGASIGGKVLDRGKTRVELDLKQPADRDAALALIAEADALIEGLRPGAMERLGLGPDDCRARNPRLAYGRMTGWGQTGPLAQRAGHDLNYIALTGALHAIGRRGEPPTVPLNLVGDYGGGATFLALGVVSAVLSARVTGEGQIVDAAMTEGAAVLMSMIYAFHSAGAWSEERESNLLDGAAPFYRCYECADGGHVAVAAIEPQFFAELLAGLNLAPDRFVQHDRARWPEMARAFEAAFLARTRDQWAELFEPTDACVAPVLSMTEAPNHPHNAARRAFATLDGIVQPMPAPRFSGGLAEPEPAEAISAEEALARWTDAG